ncbi:MAG TPA: CBS domain-containing protein [Acidimicrobiales bacterium]|jgi:CBS domain-containing protein|nr:CBS domain-containing protein [Acidimicrobiales bacterium]
MDAAPIYASRVLRLPLVDRDGVAIGRIGDLVLSPPTHGHPPRVLGFVAAVQRRDIFINGNRVSGIEPTGVRLSFGTVDLHRFQLRPGELLARQVLAAQHNGESVQDIALVHTQDPAGWTVASVLLSSGGLLRRRAGRSAPWQEAAALFDAGPMGSQVAELRDLQAADMARRVSNMPAERRHQVAEALEDERLADLLEELPEDQQVRLIESLDVERAADVLEEMEPDDAADLLGELPIDERNELLDAMEPEEAGDLRRLLAYDRHTAGGLMTSEPLIVTPETTVAEVLARMREPEMPAALGAQVFVSEPPTVTPTGRYIGAVGFQRLLREPPGSPVGDCLDPVNEFVHPNLRELEVARRLAAYDAIAVPVCDDAGRLLGCVTVDDVLDRVLPAGWRGR